MKKLAVAQVVFGILVVGSLLYWGSWLSDGYLYADGAISGTDTNYIGVFGNPGRVPLIDVWSVIYFSLGIAVLCCGIAHYFTAGRQAGGTEGYTWGVRLAVVQVVLGAVIVGSLVWFIGWVELDYGSYINVMDGVGPIPIEIGPDPSWLVRLNAWKVISFMLGLLVLGCGAAQFIIARRIGSNEAG
jgi:hypothetical protein